MKSRVQWLLLGYRNNKFLQLSALNRRRKNKILQLQKPCHSWFLDPIKIENEIVSYLRTTYTHISNIHFDYQQLSHTNFPSLSNAFHSDLIVVPDEFEIKKALDSIALLNSWS